MILFHPKNHHRLASDETSRQIMLKTIEFFETKGKRQLKADDLGRVWYADFLEFVKREEIFATLLTPTGYGSQAARWDTWRNCEFNEIVAFYGLCYWYTWQVSILGLGPIWMSANESVKHQTAQLLKDGAIFAFGLSEKEHGADIYSTDMKLIPQADGTFLADGDKYYIGNGNVAALVSTFGKRSDTGEYVFFAVNSQHERYHCLQNVTSSQSYVSEFVLREYPITEADLLHQGQAAWDAALNTVNIGKYNLGWASIGICTHAFYEAITHAANRRLYNMFVTDFPHVKQMFTEAYSRLVAMKLFALRAADYLRAAGPDDRRYLLYNPIVKMKVTTQGEEVVNLLWDVIAAKGFEKDMYFEMAARDIRALPKLEGTVHVNIALILKFMPGYFGTPHSYPAVGVRSEPTNDDFLFQQGPAKNLHQIRFHDAQPVFDRYDIPNVNVFKEQITAFKTLLVKAAPDQAQSKDLDFILTLGELFTLIVYAQLILENVEFYEIEPALVDQIFDFVVRDFSKFALQLYSKPTSTELQMDLCLKLIRKPITDDVRYQKIWQEHVYALKGTYEMNP